MRPTVYARDNGRYIGIYTTRSGKYLSGAVWKDNKRCMEGWEEIQKTHKIEWI